MKEESVLIGLTRQEVSDRVAKGEVNLSQIKTSRSNKEIILRNTMTIFNLLNIVLCIVVIFTGSFKNMLFIISIIFNTGIGIFQEIKAKNTIEKLSILKQDKVEVMRDGQLVKIEKEALVIDDILLLQKGMQVPVDVTCLGDDLMVDESLLTGESDFIEKAKGDGIYSGSLVMQGKSFVKVVKVGDDTYVSQLTSEAKTVDMANSKIQEHINRVLKWIAILIVPLSIVALLNQMNFFDVIGKDYAVLGIVAAIIGIMPEGLVLLVSVALAAGVLKLSTMGTLTQELPAIETLARVDTICLDKTGTITEGKMSVDRVLYFGDETKIDQMVGLLNSLDQEQNMSALALQAYFKDFPKNETVSDYLPFSSELKLQAMTVEDEGTFILGAFDMVVGEMSDDVRAKAAEYAAQGARILGFSHSHQKIQDKVVPVQDATLLALICIKDVVKEDAKDIIAYFRSQEVEVKIISGDYPDTIAAIAKEVGVVGNAIISADIPEDMTELQEVVKTTSIFGRVTPAQKRNIMIALQNNGKTVSMVGDGINDILALKQSDCAIAFGNGSEATKAVAQFVLLENDFSSLPNVVKEGRKVINNINTVAGCMMVRVIYSVILVLAMFALNISFPMEPINMTMISIITVGVPTSLLIFEKNEKKSKDRFFRNIWLNAVPVGLATAATILYVTWTFRGDHLSSGAVMGIGGVKHYAQLTFVDLYIKTFCTFIIGAMQLFLLVIMCRPFTKFRVAILSLCTLAFFASYYIEPLTKMFGLSGFYNLESLVEPSVFVLIDIILVLVVRVILVKTIFKEKPIVTKSDIVNIG